MSLDPHIFRAYDIRGRAGTQLTEETCLLIGKGFGSELRKRYGMEHPRVIVGRDARTHSPSFEAALIEGLVSSGCHVLTMGQTPSPLNYFTICAGGLDGGLHITASHNPGHDNGVKLQMRNAEAFCGEDLQLLYKKIVQLDFLSGAGKSEPFDAITPYVTHLTSMFQDVGQDLSVVVDSGNGVAGPVYTDVLEKIGCAVTGLFIEPDGTFPNHPADPSKHDTLKDLQHTVKEIHAHVGLAFDGDGDRLGLVDEQGVIRTADDILLLLAKDHLQRNPGSPVIFTVSNSGVLETEIAAWGGKPIMCKVGHSFVEHAMHDYHAKLGGEQSGHFFCGEDYYLFDDALVAALRVLKIVKDSGTTLSALCEKFPKVYQSPERRPYCPDAEKTRIVQAITEHFTKSYDVNTLDGVRIDFGEGAWAGIRQSNTSPCLSLCLEARSPEKLLEIEEIVLEHMELYPEVNFEK